jgi:hypothetical protein
VGEEMAHGAALLAYRLIERRCAFFDCDHGGPCREQLAHRCNAHCSTRVAVGVHDAVPVDHRHCGEFDGPARNVTERFDYFRLERISSATRNARSMLWRPFKRGSHTVW